MPEIIPSIPFEQLSDLITIDSTPANTLTLTNVTITVGAGKDFATIQEAIDFFQGKIVSGTCTIDVDAGSYAENLTFDSIQVMPGATLWLKGDTRALAGLSFVDHTYGGNSESRTNGGARDAACALANSTTNITVTITGGDPDFDADNWVNGDLLLVYDNAGAITEKTISSTSNKTITLTATAPTIGNTGTAVCLCPNRVISIASGTAINIQIQGVKITGFYIKSAAATGTLINLTKSYSTLEFSNMAFRKAAICLQNIGILTSTAGCISFWEPASYGIYATANAYSTIHYVTFIKNYSGIYTYNGNIIVGYYSKAVGCTAGFYALGNNYQDFAYSSTINNTTGFFAGTGAFINALLCNARATGNINTSNTDGITGSYVNIS